MATTTVTRYIHSPRSSIFRALIDPVLLVQWRFPEGMTAEVHTFDPRAGGRYRMSLTYKDPTSGTGKTSAATDTFQGRFVEISADERVVEAIRFEAEDPRFTGEMRMTTELADAADGTRVTITCADIPSGIRPEDNAEGSRMALANLARLVEQG
ncbi:MAG: SRPBCC domain-containing protein [Flavobacteriales bacterium]